MRYLHSSDHIRIQKGAMTWSGLIRTRRVVHKDFNWGMRKLRYDKCVSHVFGFTPRFSLNHSMQAFQVVKSLTTSTYITMSLPFMQSYFEQVLLHTTTRQHKVPELVRVINEQQNGYCKYFVINVNTEQSQNMSIRKRIIDSVRKNGCTIYSNT